MAIELRKYECSLELFRVECKGYQENLRPAARNNKAVCIGREGPAQPERMFSGVQMDATAFNLTQVIWNDSI